jgi:regulator of sirC expression with transglutaminase-like and TPR domain
VAHKHEARDRFAELMAEDEGRIELDRVALAIAQGEYPRLQADRYRRRLDQMAAALRPRLSPEESLGRLVAELNSFLFGEEAFHGNAVDYYDPRNSYLNDVLDRRTGIPISLSLVYLELARRVGLACEGVGLPGHFIVRCRAAERELLVDPFNQGEVLTLDDCSARLRRAYGGSLQFSPELLRTANPREIVVRMLTNLKGSYLRLGDLPRALRAVEWSAIADPARLDLEREQGLLRFRLGDFRGAARALERYLEAEPAGRLADQTRGQLRQVQELWVRRN